MLLRFVSGRRCAQYKEVLLWKHINHTPSKPLVAYSADPLLRHSNMPRSRGLRVNALADQQLRLRLDILDLLQVRHNSAFVKFRIGDPHTAFEVELQFFDR